LSFEIASSIALVTIVGVMAYFYNTVKDSPDHTFLRVIFFALTFPGMAGLSYYAKVIAVDNFASANAVSVLTTFYRFSIWMLIIAYSYLGLRTILWMLSKYKSNMNKLEPWEVRDELI